MSRKRYAPQQTIGMLREVTDGFKIKRVIGDWIDFYNAGQPHPARDGRTPAEA